MKKILFALILSFTLPAASVSAADESKVAAIPHGTSRNDIHRAIGGALSGASVNGFKESFKLSNGKTAVCFYNKWGYLDYGFIIY